MNNKTTKWLQFIDLNLILVKATSHTAGAQTKPKVKFAAINSNVRLI